MSAPEPLTFTARDGRVLSALLVRAAAPRGALVVNGATGIPREFYLKFAVYAGERGYHTLLYDYRGIGASALQPLRNDPARMSDWGLLDMPAALECLADHAEAFPLATVGHSVGGQLVGCMPNHSRARAHVMVATSTGYWRLQRVPLRYQALVLWLAYGPLMLRLRGYVPQGHVWPGLPLPPGVFRQWREWCLHPDHFGPALQGDLSASSFPEVREPLLVWGLSDDPIATPPAVQALLRFYSSAPTELRWTTPEQLGVRRIGHHGFFSERFRSSLWRGALDWIDARLASES